MWCVVLSVEWCVLSVQHKTNLIIDRGSFYYIAKMLLKRYVIVIKVNFIDKIHTNVLKNPQKHILWGHKTSL